jgi:hypothetical protein
VEEVTAGKKVDLTAGSTRQRGKRDQSVPVRDRKDGPRAGFLTGPIWFPRGPFIYFSFSSSFLFSDFRFVSKSFAKRLQINSNHFQEFFKKSRYQSGAVINRFLK